MHVIVTGAAGYIGGQTVLQLRDRGHNVVGIDSQDPSNTIREAANSFFVNDFTGFTTTGWIRNTKPDAIIHCAGTSLVGPSMTTPELYYNNNFVKTKLLLDYVLEHSPQTRIIFSSSASVYGVPVMTPCGEVDPIMPISPYGESKAMIEWMLASYAQAYQLKYVAFRYFNACGADNQARHGQAPRATHVIAQVLESIRDQKSFTIYGRKYSTPDGTCIRDYIHVEDIAEAHSLAIEPRITTGVYNLATNSGHSVLDIIESAERITGQKVQVVDGPPRAGDPDDLTASSDKFSAMSGWQPKYTLDDMIQHAWNWYTK